MATLSDVIDSISSTNSTMTAIMDTVGSLAEQLNAIKVQIFSGNLKEQSQIDDAFASAEALKATIAAGAQKILTPSA